MNPRDMLASQLNVFVSYSRKDLEFADQLVAALKAFGLKTSIDREGIHGAEKWEDRLGQLILEADTIVFVLTPASAASDVCKWEVDQAVKLGKRVVPVLWKPLESEVPHEHLRDLNYIHFYNETSVPGSGFGSGLSRLVDALETDVEWIREHTRLSELAARWNVGGCPSDLLVRGSELAGALAWRDKRPANAPELTAQQRSFLQASEGEEDRRKNADRKQIEAIKLAQDDRAKAQARTATLQARFFCALASLLSLVVIGLGVATWQARKNAIREAHVLSIYAKSEMVKGRYDSAMRIAVFGLPKEPTFFWNYWSTELETILRNSAALSSLVGRFNANNIAPLFADPKSGLALSLSEKDIAEINFEVAQLLNDSGRNSDEIKVSRTQEPKYLIKTSRDGDVTLFNENTRRSNVLIGHTGRIRNHDFGVGNRILATSSRDKTIRFWDVGSGKPLGLVYGIYYRIRFTQNGKYLVALGDYSAENEDDLKQVLVTIYHRRNILRVPLVARRLSSAYFSPSGRQLYSRGRGVFDFEVAAFGIRTKKQPKYKTGAGFAPGSLEFSNPISAAQNLLLEKDNSNNDLWNRFLCRQDNKNRKLTASTENNRLVVRNYDGKQFSLERGSDWGVSPVEPLIALAVRKNQADAEVYDEDGTRIATLYSHEATVHDIKFGCNGSIIYTIDNEGRYLEWQMDWLIRRSKKKLISEVCNQKLVGLSTVDTNEARLLDVHADFDVCD